MSHNRSGIHYKTSDEVELIRLSGDLLGRTHGEISKAISEGVSLKFIDKLAFEYIKDYNGIPSFLGYRNFPSSLCLSVNSTVVHGLPTNYQLRDGDLLSVDCGVFMNGYHSDSAYTYKVGTISKEAELLRYVTYHSLFKGIASAVNGNRVGDIGFAIQNFVEKHGYSVVRELVGHGVGKDLHEEPVVANFGRRGNGLKLLNGLVLAIEPMVNEGLKEVYLDEDGWSVKTVDSKYSVHFEHTVLVSDKNPQILTTFEYIIDHQKING